MSEVLLDPGPESLTAAPTDAPLRLVQVIGLLVVLGYTIQCLVEGYVVAATVTSWTGVMMGYSVWVYRRRENFKLACDAHLLAVWFGVTFTSFADGMSESKAFYLISVVPCLAAYLRGERSAVRWAVCATLSIIAIVVCDAVWDFPVEYSPTNELEWFIRRVIGIILFAYLAILQARRARKNLWNQELQSVELQRANEVAQRASRAKGAFLARVSHEIRTPMHGIIGMTQRLTESSLSRSDHECVQAIERCADSLQSLLNDGLELSVVEGGAVTVERVRFGLSQIVKDIVMLFSAKAQISCTQLNYALPEQELFAWGDPKRTRQVLSNLVGNALKFGAGAQVDVRLQEGMGPSGESRVELAVQDRGVGISKENQASLFSAYAQLEAGKSCAVAGTGLGLVISQDLARKMSGEIVVQSVLGQGSTFTLCLVKADAEAVADVVAPLTIPVAQRKPSRDCFAGLEALVVDDNEVNRRVACLILRAWGVKVHEARDGQIALEMAKERRFDLIFMDVQMPVMDGLEATRSIRMHSCNQETPIVALTANAFAHDRANCLAAGMDAHVAKPFKKAQLFAVCVQYLQERPVPVPRTRAA